MPVLVKICGFTRAEDALAAVALGAVSPTLAYMLFPDTAQRFLPFPVPCFDRARALQMGWEAGWEKTIGTTYFAEDFGELWRRPGGRHIPSLFFNGTSVETGKRLIMSNVQLDGSFVDCEEVARLLPAPVALSTAVDMSTRFTYVSPLGRFTNGEHIADGGYFENSGAATASDIMDIVTAEAEQYSNSIVPVLILISNDPAEANEMPARFKGSEFISEVVGPFNTLLQTREARGAYSVMDLKSRLNRTNFFKFSLVGARSPLPLGWSLSRSAISEMNRLLAAQSNTTTHVINFLPRH